MKSVCNRFDTLGLYGSFHSCGGGHSGSGEERELFGCESGPGTPVTIQNIQIPEGLPLEGPFRILVIGTTQEVREETVRLLQIDGGPGWEPDAVGDVLVARTRLRLESWDLVLLRLDAGTLDFQEIFRTIRTARQWPTPSVVAVLNPDPVLLAEIKALGVRQALITPLIPESLIRAVRLGIQEKASSPHPPGWEAEKYDGGEIEGDDPLI